MKGKTVIIEDGEDAIHAYHMGTGEVLVPTKVDVHHPRYDPLQMQRGNHYPHHRIANKEATLPEDGWPGQLVSPRVEWVKDPEGKNQLWLPVKWRTYNAGWFNNITTLWLNCNYEAVIIRL